MRERIAVISTGNGGQSMAAYLSLAGCDVTLYAREQERVDMYPDYRFTVSGVVSGETTLSLISCDMGAVIDGAELILVTTPAQYHPVIARAMAPHLRDGQIVVLNPGRTFGTYVFDKTLRDAGCAADVTLAETDTLVFTCRCLRVGHPSIYAIKRGVEVAAHDPARTAEVVRRMDRYFPDMRAARSVLHTGLANIGMVFHPLPILMNITRVEAKEDFHFYTEGISPLVANIVERLDAERVAIAATLGVQTPRAMDWLKQRYGATGDTIYQCIQSNRAYAEVLAPTDIDTRYIYEDIMTGCVPVACVGRAVGADRTILESVVQWATTVYDYPFFEKGRNEQLIDIPKLLRDVTDQNARIRIHCIDNAR